jgi:hypothetical protein
LICREEGRNKGRGSLKEYASKEEDTMNRLHNHNNYNEKEKE